MGPRLADRRAASAAVAAAAVSAGFQQAGKATRDALFLSTFGAAALPGAMILGALTSAVLTLAASRLLARWGPGRLVPLLFGASSLLLLVEWGLLGVARPVAAGLYYLHFASLGALLLSGLWATVNERFDAWSARGIVGKVATGASVGGLFGGLLPERVGAGPGLGMMLPVLAGLHLLAGGLLFAGQRFGRGPVIEGSPGASAPPSIRAVLGGSRYLQAMAAIAIMAAAGEGVLDYVVKVRVAATVPAGDQLLRLFAVLYTATTLASILLQATVLRPLTRQVGAARTAAVLPGGVALGALGAMMVPGIGTLLVARGVEGALHGSLFRGAWELLYTPTSTEERRTTKLLLDVGATRVGDVLGGAMVAIALAVGLARPGLLLGITAILALGTLWATLRLHRTYLLTLEANLQRHAGLRSPPVPDRATTILLSFGGVPLGGSDGAWPPAAVAREAATVIDAPGTSLSRTAALASADPKVVEAALDAGSLERDMVEAVIALLAWDRVAPAAMRALRPASREAVSQLVAHLVDPEEEFAIRRRLARLLGTVPGQDAFEGLQRALADPRFEVRYHAGKALATRHQTDPTLTPDRDWVLSRVLSEVAVERGVWESRHLLEEASEPWSPMAAEVLRTRAVRSLEHVFHLLSLLLPPEPLRLSFEALQTSDPGLRGAALEYLATVLPATVRVRLWPYLDPDERRAPASASPDDALERLLGSRQSILVALASAREQGA